MKNNIAFRVVCSVMIFMFSGACHYDSDIAEMEEMVNPTDTIGNDQEKPCNPDSIYFTKDIYPILQSNCAFSGCHGDGSAQDGVDISS